LNFANFNVHGIHDYFIIINTDQFTNDEKSLKLEVATTLIKYRVISEDYLKLWIILEIVNMSDTAAAKRAERRRQRILQNSDDRMKRIFGGENYHEEHLKLAETPIADTNENLTPFVRSLPRENMPTRTTTEPIEKSNPIQTVKIGTFWIFWTILGMLTRLVLESSYSWIIGDNSLTAYVLIFTVFNILLREKQNQMSAGGIFDIVGLFAGLDSKKISSIKFVFSIVSELFNTLLSYFAGFLLLDIVLTNM